MNAIALKAMASSPQDRYASAEMFRQDLLSWIAGEPVSAYRERWSERALRWLARHRTLSSALASAIGIAMFAGSLLLWLQAHQKHALDDKAKQLRIALDDSARLLVETRNAKAVAEGAEQKAKEGRRIAIESKEVAQKREGLAFEALLRFQDILLANQAAFQSEKLFVVQEQLLAQTKATFAGILGNLSEKSSPQPHTPRYLQVLTHRLAAMERFAGRTDQAIEVIDQACSWMQRCMDLADLETAVRTDLQYRIGELRSLQGCIALLCGQIEKAIPMIEQSVGCLEPLEGSEQIQQEDRVLIRVSLTQAYSALASIESSKRNFEKAKEALGNALRLITAEPPTNHVGAMAIAQTHFGMAILYEQTGEPRESLEQFERAAAGLQKAEELADGAPPLEFIAYRSQLTHHRSNLLLSQGDLSKAIEVMHRQLQRDAASVQKHLGNSICLDAYSKTATTIQSRYSESQQLDKAFAICRDWSVLSEQMLLENLLTEPVFHFATVGEHIAGHLDQQNHDELNAQEHYRSAIDFCKRAEANQLISARLIDQRVELEMHLFDLRLQRSDMDGAEKHFENATDATHKLPALAQNATAEFARAIGQLQRGIELMRKANQHEPADRWEKTLQSKNLLDASISEK